MADNEKETSVKMALHVVCWRGFFHWNKGRANKKLSVGHAGEKTGQGYCLHSCGGAQTYGDCSEKLNDRFPLEFRETVAAYRCHFIGVNLAGV